MIKAEIRYNMGHAQTSFVDWLTFECFNFDKILHCEPTHCLSGWYVSVYYTYSFDFYQKSGPWFYLAVFFFHNAMT